MKSSPTLAVATPTRGLVHSLTVESVHQAMRYAIEAGKVESAAEPWWVWAHGLAIPKAHERVTEQALATGADLVLMIEDDNVLPEQGIVRALEVMDDQDADVVAIDYPVGTVDLPKNQRWDSVYRWKGEILFTALGLTLIRRRVFEKLTRPWFRIDRRMALLQDGSVGLVNKPYLEGQGGVDVVFGLRCREAGLKLAEVPGSPFGPPGERMLGGHIRITKLGGGAGSGLNQSPHEVRVWDTITAEQQILDERFPNQGRFHPPEAKGVPSTPAVLNLEREFRRLRPWVSGFVIGSRHYGGAYDPIGDPRIALLKRQLRRPPGRVLEFGSLEGGHTAALAGWAGEVVGIEGRPSNVRKARFVLKALAVSNAQILHENLETCDLALLGSFDLAFCVGLLYHLPDPVQFLKRVTEMAPQLFLWTHHGGETTKAYREAGLRDPLSGLSARSTWLPRAELLDVLGELYQRVKVLNEEPDHPAGPAITVMAER